ncbi:methylamine utilization protein [Pseudoalteromonas sp. SSDWG2]|uniref:methylamine utilization protein n=1 Tax=Pseudoalteromonas sp. SSDWG2 TaxID=3139391 RepID=UPI003BAC1ABD
MKRITILMFSLVFNTPLFAFASTVIKVVDQHGKPVNDAVIEIRASGAHTAHTLAQPAIMDQVNKAFAPHVLVVPKESYVSFPNSDDIRHHVYSFSKAKPFELKLYSGQPKQPLRFEQSGVVVLGCNIHDAMVGYVYVYEGQYANKTNADGQVELPIDINDNTQMWLWHPRQTLALEQRMALDLSLLEPVNGAYKVVLEVTEEQPRDSFEDVFSNAQ